MRLLLALFASQCSAFMLTSLPSQLPCNIRRAQSPSLGLFDMFKESEEQKAAKEAEWKAQQEIINRRRNPEAMAAYEAEVNARRAAAAEKVSDSSSLDIFNHTLTPLRCHPATHLRFSLSQDAELKELQKGNVDGDAMEGGSDFGMRGSYPPSRRTGRQASGRWESEGLMPDRLDEEMPFIDSGYVDDSQPDIMEELSKGFGKLFGGDKK